MKDKEWKALFKSLVKNVIEQHDIESPNSGMKKLYRKIPKGEIKWEKDGTVKIEYEVNK